jgi:hypothetical protein
MSAQSMPPSQSLLMPSLQVVSFDSLGVQEQLPTAAQLGSSQSKRPSQSLSLASLQVLSNTSPAAHMQSNPPHTCP